MIRRLSPLIFIAALAFATPASAAEPRMAGEPTEVVARPLSALAFRPERTAPAAAQGINESRISAEVRGTVAEVGADVGATVARGAVLVRIDPRDYQITLERARAAARAAQAREKLAEAQLRSATELAAKNFISPDALSQRQAEVEVLRADAAVAQAQIEAARRDLDKTVIRAPYAAIVKQRQVQAGELAQPGAALMTLVDRSRIEIAAQVQAADLESLRRARDIRFDALGERHAAKLTRISPAINREARNVEVRLAFAGEPAPPGADGRIVWLDHRPHLDADLLVRRDGRLGVFVAEEGKARFVPIEGAQEGRPAAVPLPESARIVVDGRHALRDGQPVRTARP